MNRPLVVVAGIAWVLIAGCAGSQVSPEQAGQETASTTLATGTPPTAGDGPNTTTAEQFLEDPEVVEAGRTQFLDVVHKRETAKSDSELLNLGNAACEQAKRSPEALQEHIQRAVQPTFDASGDPAGARDEYVHLLRIAASKLCPLQFETMILGAAALERAGRDDR